MRIKNKNLNKNKDGFTLIEILIVTVIAGMVFTTIYAFYVSVIKFNVESRYEVIASNLAQEGIEIIRNRRDQNVLRGGAFKDGIGNTTACYPVMSANPSCAGGGSKIRKDLVSGVYIYTNSSSGNTPFSRVCDIGGGADEVDIVCTVTWDSFAKSGTRKVVAKSLLTDWYTP